jgi:nucleoside-diphosphate-sugar epimerase
MGETLNVWGDGTNYRDYIYIGDLTEAISRSITLETKKNYLINIGTGYGIKIIDLVRLIEKITLKKIDINFLPPRTIDVNFNVLDIGKAKKILKWEPKINIEQGIKITWDWLKKI